MYVGLSLYYIYFSILNGERNFNIFEKLKQDGSIQTHIDTLITIIEKYQKFKSLKRFFLDVRNPNPLPENLIYDIKDHRHFKMSVLDLLIIFGIPYEEEAGMVTPIIPLIFKEEFEKCIEENYDIRPILTGLEEEELFAIKYFSFCRILYEKYKNRIDLKKMFSFLKRFPDLEIITSLQTDYLELPRITQSTPVQSENKEMTNFADLKSLNSTQFGEMLKELKYGQLYRHRESSSSADFMLITYIPEFEKKLYLFFQIKKSKTVDLLKEYRTVFLGTNLELEKNSIYRLIIFNSSECDSFEFTDSQPYIVKKYDENRNKFTTIPEEEYNQMNELESQVLIYYMNPKEYEKFKYIKEN